MVDTYKIVGVSFHRGKWKIRFSNTVARIRDLEDLGHTNMQFVNLPGPMSKQLAVEYMQSLPEFADIDSQTAISAFLSVDRTSVKRAIEQAQSTIVRARPLTRKARTPPKFEF
jgi:hypothetical protein